MVHTLDLIGKLIELDSHFPRKPCSMTAESIELWRLETESHCSHLTEEIRYCLAKTLSDTQRL